MKYKLKLKNIKRKEKEKDLLIKNVMKILLLKKLNKKKNMKLQKR